METSAPVGMVTREAGFCMYVGKCRCGRALAIEAEGNWNYQEYLNGTGIYQRVAYRRWFTLAPGWGDNGVLTKFCGDCGKSSELHQVDGKKSPDVPCDARCTSATGPSCSCSCGGANHGKNHA